MSKDNSQTEETDDENEQPFTEEDFDEALRKASRPLSQEPDEETDKTSE